MVAEGVIAGLLTAVAARLVAANTLSDPSDKTAARINLGLGDVATMSMADVVSAVRDALSGKEI